MERFLVLKWKTKVRRSATCPLHCRLSSEQTKIYTKATEKEEANVQVFYGLSDGIMNPGQATEALTDENSNVRDRNDIDQVPGLINENAEEDIGLEIYKRNHIDLGVQPRAPGWPIIEKRGGDSSELMQNTIDSQSILRPKGSRRPCHALEGA
jgi:hypothetical protein